MTKLHFGLLEKLHKSCDRLRILCDHALRENRQSARDENRFFVVHRIATDLLDQVEALQVLFDVESEENNVRAERQGQWIEPAGSE